MFWKEADPGPACFPAFPRAGWPGEGWEEPLHVWQTVGSELKRLLNKKIAFYKQVFKLWFPIRAFIKAPVCFGALQNGSWHFVGEIPQKAL